MFRTNSGLLSCAIALIAAILIAACVPYSAMTVPVTKSTATSNRTYMPIDFEKWASGLYPDHFFGKSVVVEGYYNQTLLAGLAGSTSYRTDMISNSITFSVSDKSISQLQQDAMASARSGQYMGQYMGMPAIHTVPVTAPISMRDIFFKLQPGSRIRVYGEVVNPYSRSVFHGGVVSSTLQVKAERVEVL